MNEKIYENPKGEYLVGADRPIEHTAMDQQLLFIRSQRMQQSLTRSNHTGNMCPNYV
jgi:hypothetical protein